MICVAVRNTDSYFPTRTSGNLLKHVFYELCCSENTLNANVIHTLVSFCKYYFQGVTSSVQSDAKTQIPIFPPELKVTCSSNKSNTIH